MDGKIWSLDSQRQAHQRAAKGLCMQRGSPGRTAKDRSMRVEKLQDVSCGVCRCVSVHHLTSDVVSSPWMLNLLTNAEVKLTQ